MKRIKFRRLILSPTWTPKKLFNLGDKGFWFSPLEASSLFQDVAGTVPATAINNPVGLMKDLSGNGYHAIQATATSRPVLSAINGVPHIKYDGIDDSMTGTNSVMSTGDVTLVSVMQIVNLNNTWQASIILTSSGASSSGVLAIGRISNTTRFGAHNTWVSATPEISVDLSGREALSNLVILTRKNSGATGQGGVITAASYPKVLKSTGVQSFISTESTSFRLGSIGQNQYTLNGYLGELIAINRAITDDEAAKLTKYIAKRYGL